MLESNIAQLEKKLGIITKRSDIRSFVALLGAIFIASTISPKFLTPLNLNFIIIQAGIILICGLAETFVILTGSIDLSVGSTVGFAGVLSAILMVSYKINAIMTIFLVLFIGVVIGFANGLITVYLRIPSIVTTLATMTILRGLCLLFTNAQPISSFPADFLFLGKGALGPIPVMTVIYVALVILLQFILTFTRFGRCVYAIGGNEEAAIYAGINVKKIKFATFSICGLLSSLAGVLLASRLNAAYPLSGSGYELDAIAATVLGGTKMMGGAGEGNAYQTVIGAFLLIILANILDLLAVNIYYQYVVRGVVLAVATIGMTKGIIIK